VKPEHWAYWHTLHNRFLDDVELLLREGCDESAMLLMCSFIDAVSSFYTGRATEKGVKDSFRTFVEQYLSTFARVQVGDLLFDDSRNRRVNDCVDMLYFCYRNGLVHEGSLPVGIKLVRPSEGYLFLFNAMGIMELNTPMMYLELREAIRQYQADLEIDATLQSKFAARIEYIQRGKFKKGPHRKT
jgi:hypothetical protein